MPKWWSAKKEESEEEDEHKNDIEIKPPKEVTEKLAKIDNLELGLNELKDKSKVLDRMSSYLDEQDNARQAARAKEAAERAKKATENQDEEWLTDPQKAFQTAVNPLVAAQINTSSQILRRDIFNDGKEFEFYQGDFKKKVDQYIDQLPLQAKNDPASIKNCYFLVLGQSQAEIRDGKLKSRFAAVTTSNAKDGTNKGESSDKITLSDEQKRAAARLGVPENKYAARVKEFDYV